MSPQICFFSLIVMVTVKMLFSLLLWQPSLRLKNAYSPTQKQNIKLVSSPNFKSRRLLFLELKIHKGSFPHFKGLGIAIGAKVFQKDQNFDFSF